MEEKVYKTMRGTGAANIGGAKLLSRKSDILF